MTNSCNRKIKDHAGWVRNQNNIVGTGVDIPGRAETQKPNAANTLTAARGQNRWHRLRRTTSGTEGNHMYVLAIREQKKDNL